MAIPAGVILIWTGTNASIPAGWTRETALDDKFPKGHGAQNPNTSGGSNTHSHSDGGHTHTLISHTHTYATGNSGTFGDGSYSGSGGGNASGNHNHSSSTTTAISGGTLSDTVTWASVNQEPPYYKVIFVKPSGLASPIKAGLIAHYNGATVPTGYYYCDGNNSTPDLRDKYLKGASTGADAGSTGGALTHQHTITHGHTGVNHSHTGGMGSYSGDSRESGSNDVGNFVYNYHSHTATLNNTANAVGNYTKTDAGASDTVEPAYKKIGLIKCATPSLKLGMIGLWLGAIVDCPKNWIVCDGNNGTIDMRDKFIKIPSTLANNNDTGGSNTHAHTGVIHTHTSTGTHVHTGQTNTTTTTCGRNPTNSGALFAHPSHTHALSSISAVTATYNDGTTTPASVDNQPAYLTVAYIQLIKLDLGGAFLMSKLM